MRTPVILFAAFAVSGCTEPSLNEPVRVTDVDSFFVAQNVTVDGELSRQYAYAHRKGSIRVISTKEDLLWDGKVLLRRTSSAVEEVSFDGSGSYVFPSKLEASPTNPIVLAITGFDQFTLDPLDYNQRLLKGGEVKHNPDGGLVREGWFGNRLLVRYERHVENGVVVGATDSSYGETERRYRTRILWKEVANVRVPYQVDSRSTGFDSEPDHEILTTMQWRFDNIPEFLFDPATLGKVDPETLELVE